MEKNALLTRKDKVFIGKSKNAAAGKKIEKIKKIRLGLKKRKSFKLHIEAERCCCKYDQRVQAGMCCMLVVVKYIVGPHDLPDRFHICT